MAHHSTPGPDSDQVESAGNAPPNASVRIADGELPKLQSNVADLTAKFSSKQGGGLSRELSLDLALEIVLNEIAQQACASTGASGAAVILQRDGDWVCRASSGAMAPELGAKVSPDSGLTAECMKTRQPLRCDDAETDPRADSEVCRSLGVRSMIVLPLVLGEELFGVLAAFSPNPSAFQERNENILQALSQCAIDKIAWTRHSNPGKGTIHNDGQSADSLAQTRGDNMEFGQFEPVTKQTHYRGMAALTWTLAAIVLIFAVLLTTLASERLLGKKMFAWRPAASRSRSGVGTQAKDGDGPQAALSTLLSNPSAGKGAAGGDPNGDATKSPTPAGTWRTPAGGLTIYENGKEVFRQAPQVPQIETPAVTPNNAGAANSASGVAGQTGAYQLPWQEAEKLLEHRVEPDYPEPARLQQIQGDVVLEVRAAPDGSVQNVSLVSGHPLLADAAVAATKQWHFKPYRINGKPVAMQTRVVLNFRLSN